MSRTRSPAANVRFNRFAFKALRERTHLSLRELAEQSGVSASYISGLERGDYQPSFETVRKLAEALVVSVAAIASVPEEEAAS